MKEASRQGAPLALIMSRPVPSSLNSTTLPSPDLVRVSYFTLCVLQMSNSLVSSRRHRR